MPLNEGAVIEKTEDLAFLSRFGCVVVMSMFGVGVGEAAVEAEVDCLLEPLQVGGVLDSGEVRVVGPLVAEPRGVSA